MAEIDPDLLREWGQMLIGIGEEMTNVANAIDPPEYAPNVMVQTPALPHGKPAHVPASQGVRDVRGLPAIYGELSPMYYDGRDISKTASTYERPTYTYHIREDMNHAGMLAQIEQNKSRPGVIVHVLFPDGKRVIA